MGTLGPTLPKSPLSCRRSSRYIKATLWPHLSTFPRVSIDARVANNKTEHIEMQVKGFTASHSLSVIDVLQVFHMIDVKALLPLILLMSMKVQEIQEHRP